MATKDPLKKLMRRFPAPAELESLLDNLADGDDRTIAITGASILEAILERFLKRKLVVCDDTLAGQLFYNRGPLSDFHGKIVIAQAAGYITPALASELLLVKSVRNAFAHSVIGISFETPEIVQKVDASQTAELVRHIRALEKLDLPRAALFALLIRLMVITLDIHHQTAGGESLTTAKGAALAADLPNASEMDSENAADSMRDA